MGKALNLAADLISKPLAFGYCTLGAVYWATSYAWQICHYGYEMFHSQLTHRREEKKKPQTIREGTLKVYLENTMPQAELELLLDRWHKPLWTEKREDPRINLK